MTTESLMSAALIAAAEGEKTREVYWGLTPTLHIVWYVVSYTCVLVFAWGVLRLAAKYRRGTGPARLPLRTLPRRLGPTLVEIYSHRRIGRRDGFARWAHQGILVGFTILFIGTVLIAINTDLTKPLFGWDFLTGNFYLAYKFLLNVFGILFLGGLVAMMYRRGGKRPAKLDYTPQDPVGAGSLVKARSYVVGDWTFVITLVVIGITGYALQGVRLAMDDPGYNLAHFGGVPFAWLFDAMLSDSGLVAMRHFLWWLHGVLAVIWFASVPYTKASHMLTAVVTLAMRAPQPDGHRPTVQRGAS